MLINGIHARASLPTINFHFFLYLFELLGGIVSLETLSKLNTEMPFVVAMITGVILFLIGIMVGIFFGMFIRLQRLPTSWRDLGLAEIHAWTNLGNKTVFECFANEDKDLKHLLRNLDYMTRPTSVVNILDDRYVVVQGTSGSRLVIQSEFNRIQRARDKQIQAIATAIGGKTGDIDWRKIINELQTPPLSHQDHIERIKMIIPNLGIDASSAGEYSNKKKKNYRQ